MKNKLTMRAKLAGQQKYLATNEKKKQSSVREDIESLERAHDFCSATSVNLNKIIASAEIPITQPSKQNESLLSTGF